MNEETTNDMDAQVASLTEQVKAVLHSLDTMTAELRRTNDTVQALHRDQSVTTERVARLTSEVWTSDNASRIRSCELHIRGLWAILGFLGVVVGTQVVAALLHVVGLPMAGWGK